MILSQSRLFDNSQLTNSARSMRYNPCMEIIYVDSLFCLNLLADYLLCLVAARACGLYLKRLRYLAAALTGAAYSVSVFLPGLSFLAHPAGKLLAALLMGLIAFGSEERPLRCTLVFLALSAGFAGAVWAISMNQGLGGERLMPVSFRVCFLSFALCYAAASLFFRRRGAPPSRSLVSVQVEHMGKAARFTALMDTGNSLCDPASGKRVLVASPHALEPVLGKSSPLLCQKDPICIIAESENDPALRGRLRLIPYSALGGSGLLAAFQPEKLFTDSKAAKDILIAVSPSISGKDFEAVL